MELKRRELLGTLEKLMPGIDRKVVAENTGSFIFDGSRVYTYNDSIGVSVLFETGLKCAVPANSFYRFLAKLPDETVSIEHVDDSLKVKGAKSKATLKVMNDVSLPFDEKVTSAKNVVKIPDSNAFVKAIKFCMFTTNRHTQGQVMGCIHVGSDSKGTFAESTDSTRLTRYYFTDTTLDVNYLVPLAAAQALIGFEVKSVAEAEGWLVFNCAEGVTFATWTLAAEFPNLKKHIASFGEVVAEITLPPDIIETLERAEILAVADTKVDQDIYIVFKVEEGKMKVTSSGVFGKFSETLDVEYTGKDVSFALPPLFVRDMFKIVTKVQVLNGVIRCAKKKFFHFAGIIENDE